MIEQLHAIFLQYLNRQKETYRRYLWETIDHNDKLIGLVGARGVGKTTYILQYLEALDIPLSKKLYISADNVEVVNATLLEIAERFATLGGKILAIDEIHKYPDFEIQLKLIYDTLDIRVIFSGSSAIQLEHAKADLSRRAVLYRVNGLSYREFLEIKTGKKYDVYTVEDIISDHLDIAHKLNTKLKPLEHWKEYLEFGFYPFYFSNTSTYKLKLHETVNTVIEVDIPSVFTIKYENVVKLKKLTALICSSKPFKLNIKELSQKVGVDRETLYHFIEYLNRGKIFLVLRSRAKGDNIFLKPDKIYLNNSNLNYSYCETQEIGTIRETFFANQLGFMKRIEVPDKGDFVIDGRYYIEIGGKNKSFKQIKDIPNSFVVADDLETGFGNKIPLWLFGFLY